MADIDDAQEFKAKLDDEDILEELGLNERAVLDSEGIFDDTEAIESDQEEQEAPVEKKQIQEDAEKPSEPEGKVSFFTIFEPLFKKIKLTVNRVKSFPFLNIALAAGIAFVFFIISVFALDQYFTKRSEREYKDFLGSIKEAVSTGLAGKSEDIESIVFETFLVPVLDLQRGESFLRTSFIIKVKELDIEIIEGNRNEIRNAIYNYMKSIDPRDIANDKKRKLIEIEIKKIINSTVKKQVVHDIVIEEMVIT